MPSRDEQISTAEPAEAAEIFLGKDKTHTLFFRNRLLFAFQSSRKEEKRMNEEEAKSAEVAPGKTMGCIDIPGVGGKRAFFPLHPGPEHLVIFYLCVLCDLCG